MRFVVAVVSSLLFIPGSAQSQEPSDAPTLAYRGARIYTGPGPVLDSATLVIRGSKILDVGKDIKVPDGARVVDVTGKVILPGLVDAASPLFIDPGTRSGGSAEQRALDALDLYQEDFKEARQRGVTTVYVGPSSSGGINGLGAVLHLDDARTVLRRDAALKLTLGAAGGEVASSTQRYGSYRQLHQAFEGIRRYREGWAKYRSDLDAYRKAKAEFDKAKAKGEKKTAPKEPREPRKDPRSEVMARALDPKNPLTVRLEAHTVDAIELALQLIEEFKLKAVLEHATEGHVIAKEIAKAKVAVVAGPVFRYGPSHVDYLNHTTSSPGRMAGAGVGIAIGSFGDPRAGHRGAGASRFLVEAAAVAASQGLATDRAIASITYEAARALGIEKEFGSIEKGKRADLVVFSGEPFSTKARVEQTLIDGKVVYDRTGEGVK